MANHAKLRKQVLASAHRRSKGDPQVSVDLSDVAKDLHLELDDVERIVRQLADKGSVRANIPDIYGGGGTLTMTMKGIEEAEKMDEPFFKKLADQYPFLYQCCWTVFTLLVGAFLLWLVGLKR
jgi:hypothetical protein